MNSLNRIGIVVGLVFLAAGLAAMPPSDFQQPINDNSRSWDNETYINAGNILMFVTNHGGFGWDPANVFGYGGGTFYPYVDNAHISDGTLTDHVLYAAGLWVGGRVNGEIRMAVAEYSSEYCPGLMVNGQPPDSDNPAFRVYKLYSDSLGANPNADYLSWPVEQGAPVDDLGQPAMLGDQMLWTVFNDAAPVHHTNRAGSTAPLGIDVKQTVWAYDMNDGDSTVVSETGEADHIGPSLGHVEVTVADPSALTGHTYAVVFEELNPLEVVWHVIDVTVNDTVLANQTNQSGEGDYPVVDGLHIRVLGPQEGVIEIIETASQYGPVDPPDDVMGDPNSTGEWYVDTYPSQQWERLNFRGYIGTYDWEIRFTAEGSQYYEWYSDELAPDRAPFEVWNIGMGTPDDPSDDVRIFFKYLEEGSDNSWGWADRIYPFERPYYEPAPQYAEYTYDDHRIGRIGFFEVVTSLPAPAEGTIVRFVTNKITINMPADSFFFVAPDYQVVATGGESNVLYIEYKLYNSSSSIIEDAYISLWSDPDLGDAGDDLVGCDTMLDLFYCYNSDNDDAGHYNSTPPAVGFKVLSGPVVPSPSDTADFDGTPMPGYKNLPMTSFQKYINGTDPNNFMESYNYMKGLSADGSPLPNGTHYAVPGDPVTGVGDLDYNPADCRMMGTCGPLTLVPGDSQYIFIKMAVGHGDDRLSSITLMKELLNSPQPQVPLLKTAVEPHPLSMMMLNALDPIQAVLTFGYDADGPFGEYFEYGNLAVSGLPPIDSMVIAADHPGFNGEVARFYFPLTELLTPYQPLFDSVVHAYSVTGQYVDGEPFSFNTTVTIHGHQSGDLNLDGSVDISDLVYMIEYFFTGGPAPELLETADLDQNGTVDISDMMLLIEQMFGQ